MLGDPAVGEAEQVHLLDLEVATGGLDAEALTAVRRPHERVGGDELAVGDMCTSSYSMFENVPVNHSRSPIAWPTPGGVPGGLVWLTYSPWNTSAKPRGSPTRPPDA